MKNDKISSLVDDRSDAEIVGSKRSRHVSSKNSNLENLKKQKIHENENLSNKNVLIQIKDEDGHIDNDFYHEEFHNPKSILQTPFSMKKQGPFMKTYMNMTATKNDSVIDMNKNDEMARKSFFVNNPEKF